MIVIVAMLMLGTSTFAQVNVTLPNVSGLAGTNGSGAITVGDLTGKNVTAFQFQITYDKKIIYITGINTTNTILGNNTPTVNADTANGKILVAWASATALTGSGNLVNLNFTYRKGGQSTLDFGVPSTFMFNAGSPTVTITSGSATIPQVLVQGGSINARVGDTIKIPIMVSAITDAENVRSYDFAATFDENIINISSSDLTATLSNGGTVALNADNTNGTIRVAWASSNRIISTSETTLLYLTGTAVGIGATYINFTSFEVNQGSPLSYANPAAITVGAQIFIPTLTLSPAGPSYTTSDGVQLKITLNGAEQNANDVPLVYSITSPAILPAGASLNGNVFTWTPTVIERSATPYSFTFQVKEPGGGLVATQTVSITVTQNYAPTLTLSPAGQNFTASDGVQLKITLNGADQNPTDVPLLQYSITAPSILPVGVALTGNVFTWTSTVAQRSVTPYSFTFQVKDQLGLTATQTVSITVTQNYAPTLTLSPAGPNYTTTDGVELKITLNGADQNPTDVPLLQYSITAPSTLPTGVTLTGNVFSWTPIFTQRSVNPYSFTFQVKDQLGLTATQTVSITVTQNYAPTLTLSPAGQNFTTTDGVEIKLTLNGADQNPSDVPLLAYSITSPTTLPVGAKLTGNVFTWTPVVAERSATPYIFVFQVKDQGGLTATQTVNITVTQNYAPTLTLSPDGPNYSVNEGGNLIIKLIGADQNPDDVPLLQYSVSTDPSGLPAGAKLTANVFSWTPSFDQGRTSPYGFIFKVTDPFGASVSSSVSITVVNVDRPPVFTQVPDYIIFPITGTTVDSFQYIAVDPDGDQVSYSMLSGPAGSNVNADGLFTWKPTEDQDGHIYTVTVQATDGQLSTTTSQLIGASDKITDVQKLNYIPKEYYLFQNYPNPFNPTTSIQFAIPKESHVKLSVFNILGQEIQVLVNKNMNAGNYKINFNASKLNSGLYLYRIETADYTSVRKMLLVK
jgi:hypothetical protein